MGHIKLGAPLAMVLALHMGAAPAAAGDGLAGGLIGGVIGGMIGAHIANNNRGTPQRSQPAARPRAPQISAAQREENRKIQVSLNHMGCEAGTPDGVFGRRTQAAVLCFQRKIEVAQTGSLTRQQREMLVSYYASAQTPGPAPQAAGLQGPVTGGAGGLLDALRNTPQPAPVPEPVPVPQTTLAVAAVPVADPAAALCGTGAPAALPGTRAPLQTALVDGIPAVGFCGLRAALIGTARRSAADLGTDLATLREQCALLAQVTAPVADSTGTPAEVMQEAAGIVGPMVADAEAAVQSARMCAGIGYETADPALAEAASLFGAAAGDPSLLEVPGWHRVFGLGGAADRAAGGAWLAEAAAGMAELDPSHLLMPEADRIANLQAVAQMLAGPPRPALLPGLKN